MKTFKVPQGDVGTRLDAYLCKLLDVPWSMVCKALRKKKIKVNGARVTDGKLRLNSGDVLEVYVNDEMFRENKSNEIWRTLSPDINIVYEDEFLLIADKPCGLLSQSETEDSLEGRIRAYLQPSGGLFLPSLCHRIDRNTSGLVIAGKTANAVRIVCKKIKMREIQKFYTCRISKMPSQKYGSIEGYIEKSDGKVKFYSQKPNNKLVKRCALNFKIIENGETPLAEVELLTGRTHQIRASFAHIGCPILGDVKYGAQKDGKRSFQQLRAYKLVFNFTTVPTELKGLPRCIEV